MNNDFDAKLGGAVQAWKCSRRTNFGVFVPCDSKHQFPQGAQVRVLPLSGSLETLLKTASDSGYSD